MSETYHHGDLKTALLAYARSQLEREGPESLSMREMAKAIEVSHTAAYRHYADKGALLDAVAVQGFHELKEQCEQASVDSTQSPRERLSRCGLAYVRFGLNNPMLLDYMFSAAARDRASDELKTAGAALFAVLQSQVTLGQSQSAFRSGDARSLAHSCWAMVHGLATLLSSGKLLPANASEKNALKTAATSLELFLDGLERKVGAAA